MRLGGGPLGSVGLGRCCFIGGCSLCYKKSDNKREAGLSQDLLGLTFQQVRKIRLLWWLCLIQFLFFFIQTTIPVYLSVHGMDLGIRAGWVRAVWYCGEA